MTPLPDAEALVGHVAEALRPLVDRETAMVGIHTGGVWLAERFHSILGLAVPLGTLDGALYRDDFHRQGLAKHPKRSRIPFDVEGRRILLIDDVLYTGRTVRAAINELFDHGRPQRIVLAVLADRGGRQLPIAPDVCGERIDVPEGRRLRLRRSEAGVLALEIVDAS